MRLPSSIPDRADSAEIMRPARFGYIGVTLIVALLANLLALPGIAQILRPDLIALTLIYWVVYHPRRVGFLPAWILGLAMDVADGSLFGQHALAYAVLMYLSILLHRRIVLFGMRQQMLHVLAILAAGQTVMLLIRAVGGADFPGAHYYVPSLLGALLWPALFNLIRLPLRPRSTANVA
ncbi:MAG TPA: rod shape-determining protein MreD [Burkholderiales bacterium]|nr:rod shape-determining protein MreD [Burkholderiales bacterium]